MKVENRLPELEDGVQIKDVVGFEGFYMVTDDGRVWSVPREAIKSNGVVYTVRGGWLKLRQKWREPYLATTLRKGGRRGNPEAITVHILVARSFLGIRPPGMDIDHIDRNPQNNRASNLRYVERSMNNFNRDTRGCYWSRIRERWVAQIMVDYKHFHIGCFDAEEEAHTAYLAEKKERGVYTP